MPIPPLTTDASALLPGAATLVSPSGSITDTTPTYTWNKVSAATWYYIYVSGPSNYVSTQWYRSVDVCGASTGTVASATPGLASGQYRWWIQTWNNAGYGPRSEEHTSELQSRLHLVC